MVESNRGKEKVSSCFLAKNWNPLFADNRKPKRELVPYVQWKREVNAPGDHLDHFFLTHPEDLGPACGFDEVKLFCEGICLETLKSGVGDAGTRRGAILDDKSCIGSTGGRCATACNAPLTATELYVQLNKPRFDNPDGFDADRRRIYIANLSPSYIFALSETAFEHQVPALREAICNHVALQPSIGVKIPTSGYKVFQLEFHLPYFVLSTVPPVQNCLQKSGTSIQRKQWVDLSFLNAQAASESPRLYGIRPVQFSLVICGSDNRRWIAYAFDDTDPEIEDLPTENLSPEGLHDPEAEEDLQAEQPNCDPIRDVPDPQGLDPNHALWDPREYFLFGIEIGIAKPLDKWERLVRCLERGIKQYIREHSFESAERYGVERSGVNGLIDTKKALEWTIYARAVLNQLSCVISKINRAWKLFFRESDGDIGYFSDILVDRNGSRSLLSLSATKVAFETLEALKEDLDRLDNSCGILAKTLELRLILESNEVVQRSNEVLHRSNEEAKQANDLVRQSNEMLRKSNEEAKQANEAAQHSAVLTISIFTPFGLVAACFSMSQSVVPFTMNFRSFVISTLVMMAVANVVRLLFFASSHKLGWGRKITALMEALHLNERNYPFWSRDSGRGLFIWRGGNTNDRTTDNVELPTIRV